MGRQTNMIPERSSHATHPNDFFSAFAEKDASGAVNNVDVWTGPTDIQPEPDANGYAIFVKSDDPTDTILGDGVRTIEVHYLDTAGLVQEVSVDLDGVNEVDSGVTDCMFVQTAHTLAVGGDLVAAGNIDVLAGTGGAVVQRILISTNQAMSTMKQVPAGKKLILTGWLAVGVASTPKIANIRIRTSSHEGMSMPGVYHFLSGCRVKDFSSPWIPITFEIPALAVVKISTWTDGTISMSAHWNGYLENV